MSANTSSERINVWQGAFGPLLIAEIGGNHEGSFEAALQLTDLAIECGADVIKFQIYTGDSLVSPVESPIRHRHFQRFELSQAQHLFLAERIRSAGRRYNASVWDVSALEWLDPFLDFYKIGSGDLTAYPVLAAHAERGKPILLSTGLAGLEEVLASVHFIRSINPVYERTGQLALLQCTSMYPTADRDVNLRAMDTLRAETGVPVGYSDHTTDALALLVAAARGAEILEFHFTDRRDGRTFRDHAISLVSSEVKSLAAQVVRLSPILGDGTKRPTESEVTSGHTVDFRRAVYCCRDLRAGDVLRAEDLVVLRPNHGLDARFFADACGRRVSKDTAAFAAIEIIND